MTTHTMTIDALEVREGQTITSISAQYKRRWRRNGNWREDIPSVNGRRPTVVSVEYRDVGESGQPTVYVATSDDPGSDYCLRPDDKVTVEVTS